MYFFELFEQQNYPQEEMPEQQEVSPFEVLTPVKRYYLIQKIRDLSDRLNQLNIKNNALNIVITFIDSFSYESLKIIMSQIMDEVKHQMAQQKQIDGRSTE